jgi:hypothetical protein
VAGLVSGHRDRGPDPVAAQPVADRPRGVRLVRQDASGPGPRPARAPGHPDAVHDRGELRRVAPLPGRDDDRERLLGLLAGQAHLREEPAPRQARRQTGCPVTSCTRSSRRDLSPEGGDRPGGELAAAIDEYPGSFGGLSRRLSAATTGVQGSGWGPLPGRLIIGQIYDHHGSVGMGSVPLLVFDAREHACYLRYRNVRPGYVTRLRDLVNRAGVDRRFRAGRATLPAP